MTNKEKNKLRIQKDFSFLLSLDKIQLNASITKYILSEGVGPLLSEIAEPFVIHCFIKEYEYSGNLLKSEPLVIKKGEFSPLLFATLSMRNEENAWFNLSDAARHYDIIIEWIEYRNAENIISRRKVFEQKKEKGKQLFEANQYEKAFEVYKSIVNVSAFLPKNTYNLQETLEIKEMNKKAKHNALRCFIKMKEIEEFEEIVVNYVAFLVENFSNETLTHFLRIKYQQKRKYFTDALETAEKAFEQFKDQSFKILINEIKAEMRKRKCEMQDK